MYVHGMAESTRCSRRSPLEAFGRGLPASPVGIIGMDLLWCYRYKRGSGKSGLLDWEFPDRLDDWSNAAPGQVGKRLYEGTLQKGLAPRWAALTRDSCSGRRPGLGRRVLDRYWRRPPAADTCGTSVRLRRVAVQLRDPASREALQAHLGIRRAHTGQGLKLTLALARILRCFWEMMACRYLLSRSEAFPDHHA